jgi:hypothetical protein
MGPVTPGERSPLGASTAPKSRGPRRLATPRKVEVHTGEDGPLRRRYWEVVTDDGRNLVVFRDLLTQAWYAQR